jgi:3D (Asp-Asp-Asp) domain-containing protein
MKWKFTFKEILFTTLMGALIFGFVLWQAQKEYNQKQLELQESKQKLKDAAEKVVDALEETVKESTPKPTEEWVTIIMDVSAYCPCAKCCEQWADIPVSSGKRKTASGHTIHIEDKFVAAPRNYPFGTEMVIEGYAGGKVVKVEDVGGAIKGNKLDLFFATHGTALIWGRRDVPVRVKVRV